jgi:hypothetical protein
VTSTFWAVAAPTAVCLLIGVACVPPPGTWPRVSRAAGRLLGRFCRHMVSTPRRDPGPSHPAARVIRARRLDLTEEEARIRWQRISEKQLGEYLPKPRDGGQR